MADNVPSTDFSGAVRGAGRRDESMRPAPRPLCEAVRIRAVVEDVAIHICLDTFTVSFRLNRLKAGVRISVMFDVCVFTMNFLRISPFQLGGCC